MRAYSHVLVRAHSRGTATQANAAGRRIGTCVSCGRRPLRHLLHVALKLVRNAKRSKAPASSEERREVAQQPTTAAGERLGAVDQTGDNLLSPGEQSLTAGQRGESDSPNFLPITAGIRRPSCPWNFDYTAEAREARVQGPMRLSCNVVIDGTVEGCTVLDTLPYLTDSVLKATEKVKCSKATLNGTAVAASRIQNIRFVLT